MNEKRIFTMLLTGMALLAVALALTGCGGEETAEQATAAPVEATAAPVEATAKPEEAAGPALEGNPVRGGQLYDEWWAVAEPDEAMHEDEHMDEGEHEHEHEASGPETDHPLWATQDSNTRSGADTWRCKECHGWDYLGVDGAYGSGSHRTGFVGVRQLSGADANEILGALKGGTNPDHDFSTVMDDQDLIDLSLFISGSLIDDSELLDANNMSTGDAAAGEGLFSEVCILCHGPGGNAINFESLEEPEFIAHIAADNPWEFIHKVRFGQPGWPMPSAISNGWSNEDVADVLAYAEGFSTEPALSGGGQLYDAWWEALGLDAPTDDQPLWASQSTNERHGADTWRCKECHGWDYIGADGAYGSGSHSTGFGGVLGTDPEEMMGWLDGSRNPDHDFSGVMEPYALQALVTFMSQEMADVSAYIGADGSVNGDPAHGQELFNGTCANCHGVDGKTMNFSGDPDDPEFVGTVASDNPWEFYHKGSFGQPGLPMPAGRALGWSMQDIADLLSYAQTLPTD